MMKWKTFVIGYALALALLLFAQHRPERQERPATFAHIVDLTHEIGGDKSTVSPATQSLVPQPTSALVHPLGSLSTSESFPTRLQAPARYIPGLWTVDQIPPERLFAPLTVIDVRSQARHNPDYQLSVADIANWEQAHGHIPQGAVVIAHTGWASRWDAPRAYRNSDKRGASHFPGFSLQAVQFLVQGRNVVGLGIDTAGVSNSPVRNYAFSHSVYQIENVTNLGRAPVSGGLVLVAPAKLRGSAQAPVRVLALAR
ncbi:MAG: cyclase family protein [Chlamydiota bacterium]